MAQDDRNDWRRRRHSFQYHEDYDVRLGHYQDNKNYHSDVEHTYVKVEEQPHIKRPSARRWEPSAPAAAPPKRSISTGDSSRPRRLGPSDGRCSAPKLQLLSKLEMIIEFLLADADT